MIPFLTRASMRGTCVSTPGMPEGAKSNSCDLSSMVCGAWSDAEHVDLAGDEGLQEGSADRPWSCSGGFTLANAPRSLCRSRSMWWAVTSLVKRYVRQCLQPGGRRDVADVDAAVQGR